MQQKGYALIIVLLVLLVVGLVVGAAAFKKNQLVRVKHGEIPVDSTPSASAKKPAYAELLDWKLYKHPKLDFIIKYPPNWHLIYQDEYNAEFSDINDEDPKNARVTIKAFNTDMDGFDQMYNLPAGKNPHDKSVTKIENFSLDGQPAVKLLVDTSLNPQANPYFATEIFSKKNAKTYRLTVKATTREEKEKYELYFFKIVSTFNFTR